MSIVDDRRETHGPASENMRRIAQVWSGILGVPISGIQVAECMAGLHLVRDAVAPIADYAHLEHADGYIEIATGIRVAGIAAVNVVKETQERRTREGRTDPTDS